MSFFNNKIVIGVTGRIGVGKTTVSRLLSQYLSADIIDADNIGKYLHTLEETKNFFVKNFGSPAVQNNIVNREYISEIVFSKPEKLKIINNFFDCRIYDFAVKMIKESKNKFFVFDAAILFQSSWYKIVDKSILVTSLEKNQILRAMKRLEIDEIEVKNRIKSQYNEKEIIGKVDYIIKNNGSISELEENISLISSKIKKL